MTPASTLDFEQRLQEEVREYSRRLVELTYNRLNPPEAEHQPHEVLYDNQVYRRLNGPTPNRQVATLFGKITLWRRGYRPSDRDSGEATIFPLEIQLGLVAGATPAVAELAMRLLAEAGATQRSVLQRVKRQCGVDWGVAKLRKLTDDVSQAVERFRRQYQVGQLLELLRRANESPGCRKIVLAVGRDGVTLRTQPHSFFEVGTTATITVYDRRGNRLGSVYLAYAPELGQDTMTRELSALIRELLMAWDGPMPRLCYVTDAGDSEVKFYRRELRKMRHPRTGARLDWVYVVDYFHASLRITAMAEALFLDPAEGQAWAAKMRSLLKKPNGVARVLWSAAQLKARYGIIKSRSKAFRQAYNYLRTRTKNMQYAEYKSQGLPIGSGITEAACKTVFTQRLKLSGMCWETAGAQLILNLRVCLLSGVWDKVYQATVDSYQSSIPLTYTAKAPNFRRKPR